MLAAALTFVIGITHQGHQGPRPQDPKPATKPPAMKPAASDPAPTQPAAKPPVAKPEAAGANPGANGTTTSTSAGSPRVSTVQFDAQGWPILADDRPAPQSPPAADPAAKTAAESRPATKGTDPTPPAPLAEPTPPTPVLASGTQLGSPLLEVFQNVHAPAAFKELGGVVVWWRLSTYGAQGEVIGVRELTHTADLAFAERDRIEYPDGRVYGRSGASVFAERGGMPWPTLNDSAQHELLLFGTQLRMPWCFGDATTYAVVGRDTVTRSGDTLARILLERRPPVGTETFGPELDPTPRDHFELLYEPSNGALREFVHRFAASMQTRRVLLEDWREVAGVRIPFRRVYVDESLRQTTTLEMLRLEQQRTSERDFRLR